MKRLWCHSPAWDLSYPLGCFIRYFMVASQQMFQHCSYMIFTLRLQASFLINYSFLFWALHMVFTLLWLDIFSISMQTCALTLIRLVQISQQFHKIISNFTDASYVRYLSYMLSEHYILCLSVSLFFFWLLTYSTASLIKFWAPQNSNRVTLHGLVTLRDN